MLPWNLGYVPDAHCFVSFTCDSKILMYSQNETLKGELVENRNYQKTLEISHSEMHTKFEQLQGKLSALQHKYSTEKNDLEMELLKAQER
jgi:predicted nuclease with TOPRIM domain